MYSRDNVEDIIKQIHFKTEESSNNTPQLLKDKTFAITGKLNHFLNRDKLIEKIESYGGKVSGSISSKTSYLINNDSESNSSKNQKCKKIGIPIITEEEFLELIK